MESKRQAKFAKLVQKEMSEIFMMKGEAMFNKRFINVSLARVSPDLGYVKFYLSFLGEKEPEKLITLIKLYNKDLRTLLAEKIKNIVRKIPEIEFFYDDTMDYVEKMNKIFEEIKEKPTSSELNQEDYKSLD